MTNSIQVIEHRTVLEKDFKIYGDFENPLFLAKDVAEWIEHSNPTEMLRTIDEDEKLVSTILRSGQRRDVLMLTEDGLYEVLMQSRKPIAKEFKKQVKAILKSIRKTGMYMTPTADNIFKCLQEANTYTNNFIAAGVSPAIALELSRPLYQSIGITLPRLADIGFYYPQEIAKQVGLHGKKESFTISAIEEIINNLQLESHEVRSTYDVKKAVIKKKYADSVVYKVEAWLAEHDYPSVIECEKNGRAYLFEVGYADKEIPPSLTSYNALSDQRVLPAVMSVADVKNVLRIGRVQAYNLVHQKDFPVIKAGRRLLIPKDQFLLWLNRSTNMLVQK